MLCFPLRVGEIEQTGFGGVNLGDGSKVNNSLFQSTLSEVTRTNAFTKA